MNNTPSHYSFSLTKQDIKRVYWVLGATAIALTCPDLCHAVSVDALREPMKNLKTEMFGGWMFAVKLSACVAGAAFSVFKQSLSPLGIGAAIGAGIHFFDGWIGDGSAALI